VTLFKKRGYKMRTYVLSMSGKQTKLSERVGEILKYVKFMSKNEILELQTKDRLGEIMLVDLR
jgi:hypothetical protein